MSVHVGTGRSLYHMDPKKGLESAFVGRTLPDMLERLASPSWRSSVIAELRFGPKALRGTVPWLLRTRLRRIDSLLQVALKNAQDAPHDLAYEMENEHLTWSELANATSRVAHVLATAGVKARGRGGTSSRRTHLSMSHLCSASPASAQPPRWSTPTCAGALSLMPSRSPRRKSFSLVTLWSRGFANAKSSASPSIASSYSTTTPMQGLLADTPAVALPRGASSGRGRFHLHLYVWNDGASQALPRLARAGDSGRRRVRTA